MGLLRLNLRALSLVLSNQWLSKDDMGRSYDAVALTYDSQWSVQLAETNAQLIAHLPDDRPAGQWVDLGCGTGALTAALPPGTIGVDSSSEMLVLANSRCPQAHFVWADMLEFLREQSDGVMAGVASSWAIGYSHPRKIVAEASRVLQKGGILAFIVNYADTLKPVFQAYRRCMAKYPTEMTLALWPHFPKNGKVIMHDLARSGFETIWQQDGNVRIQPPDGQPINLQWLLKTGVLAGFDRVLPLRENTALQADFDRMLGDQPLYHHYFAGVFRKK